MQVHMACGLILSKQKQIVWYLEQSHVRLMGKTHTEAAWLLCAQGLDTISGVEHKIAGLQR